jgi:hypothetical protein
MGGVNPNLKIPIFLRYEMAEQAQRSKKKRQFVAKSKAQIKAQEEKIIYLFNDSIYNDLPCDVEPCQEKK